jgi:hypothetical protein
MLQKMSIEYEKFGQDYKLGQNKAKGQNKEKKDKT